MLQDPNREPTVPVREIIVKKASRKETYLKALLSGPSGSGKTMSALLMARGLVDDWSEIGVIDTEAATSNYYAHLGDYWVAELNEPYGVDDFIGIAQSLIGSFGVKVIIADSITHYWQELLEQKERLAATSTFNDYTAWAKITPKHNKFLTFIRNTPVHFICTVRSKQAHEIVQFDAGGGKKKTKVIKIGQKAIQREGMEYEFDLQFDIGMDHLASIGSMGKQRMYGLFEDDESFVITEETGQKIRKWCNEGPNIERIKQFILNAKNETQLRNLYMQFEDQYETFKAEFETAGKRFQ